MKKLILFRVPLLFAASEGTLTHYTYTVVTVKFLFQATDAEILLGKSKFLEEKAALFNPPGSKTVVIPKSARCQWCHLHREAKSNRFLPNRYRTLGFVITVLLSDPDTLCFFFFKNYVSHLVNWLFLFLSYRTLAVSTLISLIKKFFFTCLTPIFCNINPDVNDVS
jgi:hypothetical protein